MAVFRVEKNSGYTVMSNHHLRNRALSLKAKGFAVGNVKTAVIVLRIINAILSGSSIVSC